MPSGKGKLWAKTRARRAQRQAEEDYAAYNRWLDDRNAEDAARREAEAQAPPRAEGQG